MTVCPSRPDPQALSDRNRNELELQSLFHTRTVAWARARINKEGIRKMEMLSFGGIDVSKDRLGHHGVADEQCSSVSNTLPAGRTDRAAARLLDNGDRVEEVVATNMCRPGLAMRPACRAPDQSVQLRQVRQGSGILAKNDRLMRA